MKFKRGKNYGKKHIQMSKLWRKTRRTEKYKSMLNILNSVTDIMHEKKIIDVCNCCCYEEFEKEEDK